MKTPLRRRLTGHYSVASALEHMGPELRVQPDANLGLQDLPSTVLFLHSSSLSLAEAKNLGQKSPQPQMLHTAWAAALLTFTSPVDITLTYLSSSFTSCPHHSKPVTWTRGQLSPDWSSCFYCARHSCSLPDTSKGLPPSPILTPNFKR